MYLFERDGNQIKIYSMEPNDNKFRNYKLQEMSDAKLQEKDKIWGIETNLKEDVLVPNKERNIYGFSKPLDIAEQEIDFIKKKSFLKKYHYLIANYVPRNVDMTNESFLAACLDAYINQHKKRNQLIRLYDYNNGSRKLSFTKYLLLSGDFYITEEASIFKRKYIEQIVSLPKSLYLLELLNQGHFSLIDENVSEQISQFDISTSPIKTYTMDDLNELHRLGLSSNARNIAIKKVEECSPILKYIK